jgi:hypothetical protein
MATKAPTKPGTALAKPRSTNLVSMQDTIKNELAEIASRTGRPAAT